MFKIHRIDISSLVYPNSLKEIYDPPKVLYIKGNSDLLKEYIIGKKDIDGFTKDTVLILNEAKWINKSRVLMFTKKKIVVF